MRGQKRSKGDVAQKSSRKIILNDVDDLDVDDGDDGVSNSKSSHYHFLTSKQTKANRSM